MLARLQSWQKEAKDVYANFDQEKRIALKKTEETIAILTAERDRERDRLEEQKSKYEKSMEQIMHTVDVNMKELRGLKSILSES